MIEAMSHHGPRLPRRRPPGPWKDVYAYSRHPQYCLRQDDHPWDCSSFGRTWPKPARLPKAEDIDTLGFLATIDRLERERGMWVMRWNVEDEYPDMPWRVVLAKARRLIRKGWLDGCYCTCRGDFTVTAEGHDALAA